jgi:hypothetical protein
VAELVAVEVGPAEADLNDIAELDRRWNAGTGFGYSA